MVKVVDEDTVDPAVFTCRPVRPRPAAVEGAVVATLVVEPSTLLTTLNVLAVAKRFVPLMLEAFA